MKCPYCGYEDSKVIDSRDSSEAIRRRRECLECGARFTTYERLQAMSMLVIKKDGRREEFSREKIISGIRKACAKRPVSQDAVEQMVDDIEFKLRRSGKGEISASVIGDLVMEGLRNLDGIAYIRFASVYRDFADIEEVRAAADTYVNLRLLHSDTSQLPLFADVSSSSDIFNRELDVVTGEKGSGNAVK